MKNILNHFPKLVLLALLWLLPKADVQASHIVAGNLSYQHVQGDTFLVRLVLRRDCFLGAADAQFDPIANVWIFTSGGAQATWLGNFGTLKLPFMASDTLNEYIQSDCGFEGTQVCVHETTYQGKLVLPFRLGGYYLAYQRCCRNSSINNILSPDQTGSTYWTHVTDDALKLKNSSPVFRNWPDVYICANKNLDFDHGATDRDGDSLVYKLCIPSAGATKSDPKPTNADPQPYETVNWAPPYTLNNLMGGVPLTIDPKTGRMTANPNLIGQFLVGVCVEEYRKGKLIGTVRRDFQYNVRTCSQPPLAQFTTSESKCDGLTVSFFNTSLATNNFVWDFNYPSAEPAFRSIEKDPVFTFPSSGVYKVRLRATRGSDNCFDTLLQTVSVFTNNIVSNAKFSLAGCKENTDSLSVLLQDVSIFNEPGYVLSEWKWSVTQNGITTVYTGKSPEIQIKNDNEATVVVFITASNGCTSTREFKINPTTLIPQGDFSYTSAGCNSPGIVKLDLVNLSGPLNPFATISSSTWDVNGVTATGINTSVNLPQSTTNVVVTLTTKFAGACTIKQTKTFSLQDIIPNAGAELKALACANDSTVSMQLKYIDTSDLGLVISNLKWTTVVAGAVNDFSNPVIDFTIPKDSLLDYRLIVQYANGCLDTVGNSLVPGPFAQISFIGDTLILCPNQERTIVTNPNPAWTYIWSPTQGLDLTNPSNPKVKINENITYKVTVSDGLCSVQGEIVVIALSGGINLAIAGDTVSCDGKVKLTASGAVGQGQYNWSNEPNINTVLGQGEIFQSTFTGSSQSFYVQFVGESCSTSPAQIKVTNQKPKIEDASPLTICKSDTAKLLTVNLVPNHQNTISWNSDPHIVSDGNTYTPTIGIGANETNPISLIYNVTNQFGCTLTDTFKLTIGVNPSVNFDFDLKECGKNEFCFDMTGSYQGFLAWDFGDPTTLNDKSLFEDPCYTYTQPGTYNVVLKNLIDVCPFNAVIKQVVVNPPLIVQAGTDKILCLGDTLNGNASANITDVKYVWRDMSGNIISNLASFTTAINANSTFIVTAEDTYGCKDTDTVSAKVFVFDYTVSIPDSICVNEKTTVNLNITNPSQYTFLWTPNDVVVSGNTTPNPTILGLNGKAIKVVVTNIETGCVDERSLTPKVTKPFDFVIDLPTIFCKNQEVSVSLDINNPDNYTYLWTPASCFVGSNSIQSPIIVVLEDKDINVLLINKSSGCRETRTFKAEAGNNISVTVDAQPNLTIYEGESVKLYVKDALPTDKFVWSTGETTDSIFVSPLATTSYSVTVTDANGCTGTDQVEVVVRTAQCDESDIYLPNAFTPNQDGNNDVLRVRSNFIEELELIIYNRWGQEVFKTNDPDGGWDGTYQSEEVAPDAYAFYFKAKCVNGETYSKKGNVTLIR